MKTLEPWTICQRVEIQRRERYLTDKGKRFLRMEAVFENEFCNLQIYLSFFMFSIRIQNYQEPRRVASVY